jgi:hypothetical protein
MGSSNRSAVGGALAPILLACAATAFAAIDEASFAQCAAVGDPAARLACYDALAGRAPAAVPPVPAPAPAAAPATSAADFGKPKPAPKIDESLNARIVGAFREWQPGTVFKLDNGQTWRVTGEDSGYYPHVSENPEVVITKTFFGGYVMDLRDVKRKIKVKRIS